MGDQECWSMIKQQAQREFFYSQEGKVTKSGRAKGAKYIYRELPVPQGLAWDIPENRSNLGQTIKAHPTADKTSVTYHTSTLFDLRVSDLRERARTQVCICTHLNIYMRVRTRVN